MIILGNFGGFWPLGAKNEFSQISKLYHLLAFVIGQLYAKIQKNQMTSFWEIQQKVHFRVILGCFWPLGAKNEFSQKFWFHPFWGVIKIYTHAKFEENLMKGSRDIWGMDRQTDKVRYRDAPHLKIDIAWSIFRIKSLQGN